MGKVRVLTSQGVGFYSYMIAMVFADTRENVDDEVHVFLCLIDNNQQTITINHQQLKLTTAIQTQQSPATMKMRGRKSLSKLNCPEFEEAGRIFTVASIPKAMPWAMCLQPLQGAHNLR